MRDAIRQEIEDIKPLDDLERNTIVSVLAWIDSGAELHRRSKPATPKKHLVSYFPVIDGEYLLLVDHINAERWLPTGGHVEPEEHPRATAIRECLEELNIKGDFVVDGPILVTSTETVGKTSGHTDISVWYALRGDRSASLEIDRNEFHEAQWFHRDALPQNTDPNLERFVEKLYGKIA